MPHIEYPQERHIAQIKIGHIASVTRRHRPISVRVATKEKFLQQHHLRQCITELRVNADFTQVNHTHTVSLIDVEHDVLAMLEITEHTLFSSFQIDALRDVSTVVTNSEVACLCSLKTDNRPLFRTDTTAYITALCFEVATTVVAVADSPTLFDERR